MFSYVNNGEILIRALRASFFERRAMDVGNFNKTKVPFKMIETNFVDFQAGYFWLVNKICCVSLIGWKIQIPIAPYHAKWYCKILEKLLEYLQLLVHLTTKHQFSGSWQQYVTRYHFKNESGNYFSLELVGCRKLHSLL